MTSKRFDINSLEELVTYAVEHGRIAKEDKFRLNDSTNWEYVDKSAGEQWQTKDSDLSHLEWRLQRYPLDDSTLVQIRLDYPGLSVDEVKSRINQDRKDHQKLQPEQVRVTTWTLEEQTDYSKKYFYLSLELGQQLDQIWTHRPWYKGSSCMNRVGGLTILGMLKRLKKDAGLLDEINKRQVEAEAKQLVQARHNRTQTVAQKAQELIDIINHYPEYNEMDFTNMTVGLLAAMLEKK